VNLVAPQEAGQFVGYWQMHNSEGVPFGQTIWVAIEVSGTPPDPTEPTEPEPPTPTMTETEMPPEPTETQEPPEPTETEEPTEEPGSELQDIIWVLEEYRFVMDDEELTEPIEDVDVILEFTDQGRVEGNAGCNTYEGRYVTDGIEVIIRDVLATQLSCDVPEGLMAQEDIFLNWLERTEEYRIVLDEEENEHLELFVYIIENDQRTEKVLLIFYDQQDGPPER
jgi:heat shock protein HslJ